MPHVHFTSVIQRHLECPTTEVTPTEPTVRGVLEAVFVDNPALRSYLLDDQGGLRHHIVVFVDGTQVADRTALVTTVPPDARVDVMQALSGG